MKRIAILILLLLLVTIPFSSCGSGDKDETVTIVTTVFAEYDWVRNILGQDTDGVEVILLTENGIDLHSFQPTVSDIAKIASSDILVCVGGVSDAWIEDALASVPSENRSVIKLMSLLSEEDKLIEQSQHHNKHDHEHEHHTDDEYDEHIWLSLKNAKRFCEAITSALCERLPEYAETYTANCAAYVAELESLDAAYTQTVKEAETKALLFADRFPFSYLTNDYDLTCYAAFPGCSAENEASFETVAFLANTLKQLSLPAVVVLESNDLDLANTVIATAETKNVRIVSLDSLQSVSREEIKNGATYLELMKTNLDALGSALNQ